MPKYDPEFACDGRLHRVVSTRIGTTPWYVETWSDDEGRWTNDPALSGAPGYYPTATDAKLAVYAAQGISKPALTITSRLVRVEAVVMEAVTQLVEAGYPARYDCVMGWWTAAGDGDPVEGVKQIARRARPGESWRVEVRGPHGVFRQTVRF